jgi:hypothetical protein
MSDEGVALVGAVALKSLAQRTDPNLQCAVVMVVIASIDDDFCISLNAPLPQIVQDVLKPLIPDAEIRTLKELLEYTKCTIVDGKILDQNGKEFGDLSGLTIIE